MNVGHIARPINIEADGLSRWYGVGSPPHAFRASDRFRFSTISGRNPECLVVFHLTHTCFGRGPTIDSLSFLDFQVTILLGLDLAS